MSRWFVGLGCLLMASAAAAQDTARSPIRKRTTYEDLQMFSQVLNQIRVNHPDSVDTHDLFMAAVEGMVRAADPHSYVLPATRLVPEKEKALREGKLVPVPVGFDFFGGSPVVVSVAPGSAAAKLDVLPGDELIAVDGIPVSAKSEMELDIALAGPKGSTVTLTLERRRIDGSLAKLQRTVKRERSEEATAIPAAFMLDGRTGYVRVTTFAHDKVAEDLGSALGDLEKRGMQRLVLDLRDNGGGRVDQAARVAGAFLPEGTLVYTTEGRKKDVADEGRVRRAFWNSQKRYPTMVMVNRGTASASELVAGALQDHDRALIVGRPTFGKSLLMQGFPMTDGSVIVLVVGHVKTPCGRVVQRQYRGISQRNYYRLAGAERDTVGRPSCRTTGGRVVYGGGGIYPDVVVPEREPAPLWLARVLEEDLPLKWIGGYVSANTGAFTSLDALIAHPLLPATAMADFRAFAAKQGVVIPDNADASWVLQHTLLRGVAAVKWGVEGYYRMAAVLDPDVSATVREFARAESILVPAK